MKILLDSDAGKHEIDMAVTHTLDDLAVKIREIYRVPDSKYLYDFGEKLYSYGGDLDSDVYQCDLFIYSDEPVSFFSDNVLVDVSHENISDTIYDYCDFENPHYCPVFEEMIDIDSCYEAMMCLNGFFKIESSEELMKIRDLDLARGKCGRCIYTNCDGIHHEQTSKNLSLENIEPTYHIHLTKASPDEIETVRNAFFKKFQEPDETEE